MRSKQLYKEFEIMVVAVDAELEGLHRHHFYQMIYVLEGSGIHIINENRFDFKKGDVFLLTPDDIHRYETDVSPVFCIIDFTKFFFHNVTQGKRENDNDAFIQLEYIFHNQQSLKGSLVSDNDREVFGALIKQLISEKQGTYSFSNIITKNIIYLLLSFVARDINERNLNYTKEAILQNKTHDITFYIQQHIYDRRSLSLESIAEHFNMSKGHLSRYFKRQTGDTIKNFITRYKLEIIQTRLSFSDLTISEIAAELNFTDESHLNKVFKNFFGVTANQYKTSYKRVK